MRKILVALTGLALAAAFLSWGLFPSEVSVAEAADGAIVMRLAHINAETDPKHKEALKFKELVEEKTGGRVKIEVYGAGVLGDVREVIEGLQLGTNEVVIEGFGTIASYTRLSLLDLIPFMFRDRAHFDNMWNGEMGEKLLAEAGEKAGMELFGPSYRGVRVVTSTKRFTDVDGMKGLKIRVPADDMSVKTWQALGATPTPMAMSEVLTGIQQGVVEAQENPPILSYNFGLADACKYLIRTNHRWSADVFMMNKGYFEKLPEDIRQAIIDAGNEAAAYASRLITDGEGECFTKWADAGAEIIDPEIDGFREATKTIVEDNFPDLVEWVDKIKSVQ
ncbi:TRAP transporter substrate-binding protein [Aminithiophilus ramosus]|uniref:TRAP transporter substrate-binding protein n=1 Tax=Aminithiophilus ramosus TaxID=3029084 RepID=A0A9Q7AFY3_9BACT|nr:TRAP transporter substrate-binding protein [Aminithiophilus ramosus]QTX31400.1 TRAP transporter substrate-binding protein [Aminithiophilus ramosus]